jgi:D-mannonate dehydratase
VEEMNMDEEFDIEAEAADEEVLVYEWRVEQLARLGISTLIANAVATFIDWHDVARLVQRGCSPELALEIVR